MVTLEQIKEDILSGKCKAIYYASQSLWWTHLDSDLEESTKIGNAISALRHKAYMNRKDAPQSEKLRISNLFEMIGKDSTTPLSVDGSPLLMFTEPDKINNWITEAEKKPEHFGKHGIEAFLKAHHQNCNGEAYSKWEHYNYVIDMESGKTLKDLAEDSKKETETDWQAEKQRVYEKYDRLERNGSSQKPHHKYPSNYTPPKRRRRRK